MADFHIAPHVPETSAHKGGCYLCKLDQRKDNENGNTLEPMIDTHVEIEFEGSVVICQSCIFEMAYMLGALTPKQGENLREQYEAAVLESNRLDGELRAAQEANRVLLQSAAALYGTPPKPPSPKPGPNTA